MARKRYVRNDLPTVEGGLDRYNLAELWNDHYVRFRSSRKRIAEVGKLRRGEIKPHVPADIENGDAFRITIPHGTLMVQNIIQYLTRKQPGVRRPSGPGPLATRLADKIEHFLGAPGKGGALNEIKANGEVLWDSFNAHGANCGEYGLIVLPTPATWSHLIDFAVADDAEPDGSSIHPFFRRDARGRDPEDDFFAEDGHEFVLDAQQSEKAFDEYDRDARAKAVPFEVRILHPSVCLPIGVDPKSGKVDALLIRTQRSVQKLKSLGFDWDVIGEADAVDTETPSISAAILGGGKQMLMYELVVPGGIYYQVGETVADGRKGSTYPTYIKDAKGARTVAFVNLAADYGCDEVPGGYFYGAHHPDEMNPDLKGIPLLSIFYSLILGVNQTISSIVHHAFEVGFGGWFADPTGIDPKFWVEAGQPKKVKVNRGAVTYIAGKTAPAVHAGVDKDVQWFVQMSLSLLERFGPAQALTSGDPGDGGFAQAVAQASGENALGQILSGSMAALKRTCECILMFTEAISTNIEGKVPIYCRYNPKTGEYRDLLELGANDILGNYTIEVIFPQKRGSNLPLAQGMFQWWKGGGLSHFTWLQDGWGEENPNEEIDRINVEKALNSEAGQKLIWELSARIQGDREMVKIAQLQQEGKLGPGGTPSRLIPPRPQGDGMMGADGRPAGGMQGPQVGNPLASAVGGIMGGPMQTGPQAAVMQATGQPAPVPAGGVMTA
jgi:hypothetical protein